VRQRRRALQRHQQSRRGLERAVLPRLRHRQAEQSHLRREQAKSRSVRLSNECLHVIRKKCINTLHFASLVLSNKFGNQAAEVIDAGMLAYSTLFDAGKTICKTNEGSLRFHQALAQGKIVDTLCDALRTMSDASVMDKIDFLPAAEFEYQSANAIAQDDLLAQALMDLILSVGCRYITSAMTYSACYPMRFLVLIDAEPTQRRQYLEEFQQDFELLTTLERLGLDDPWVAGFLKTLRWADEQFTRELFVQLAEQSFEDTTEEIMHRIRSMGRSFMSTNLNEDLFNQYRFAEGASSNSSFGRISRWHRASTSTLLARYGCTPVVVTDTAKSLRAPPVKSSTFKPAASDFTLEPAVLDQYDNPSAFHHFSPQSLKLRGMIWHSVRSVGPDAAKLRKLWLSLLVRPGYMINAPHGPEGATQGLQ
jgi:hypothetical protein